MDLSELNRLEQRNEIAGILRRAKALIDRPEKWFGPAAHGMHSGALCAGIAIYRAAGMTFDAWGHPAVTFFCQTVRGTDRGVPLWNNAPERTHAEVMSAFDKAIALAEQS